LNIGVSEASRIGAKEKRGLDRIIAVCKTLGTAATSLLFEHNTRARVFGLFHDNHCMDPLHSLIKSEPIYCVQVLVTKKV
jgi:hypothetical protein